MARFVVLPVLIAFACLLAGLYGMVHNQISYTVGPDYFHAFKFHQFNIAEALPFRVGAAIVGWQASWWMGIVIGVPIAAIGLAMPSTGQMVRTFIGVSMMVVGITLVLGVASLAIPVDPSQYHHFRIPSGVEDAEGFVRAGLMHSTSYLAGLIGLVAGVIFMLVAVIRARRRTCPGG
ncbi:hypothetical protein [Nioella sediminis]|jgi:hypothetical protein|uniref:hypothetical protein n=1 Tax=Nioella sediminis TaxID=1912092 RepID=UPI0008FD1B29|nr:hypothetical protein [Nioella sediminis]TBX15441.1 hypothetical protein TK43_18795 [Roseovarius sp. JS7-11]